MPDPEAELLKKVTLVSVGARPMSIPPPPTTAVLVLKTTSVRLGLPSPSNMPPPYWAELLKNMTLVKTGQLLLKSYMPPPCAAKDWLALGSAPLPVKTTSVRCGLLAPSLYIP